MGRALPFLSTPSARRATGIFSFLGAFWGISIHALREEGDRAGAPTPQPARDFYPRPPRGGRLNRVKDDVIEELFLSTPSARRATTEWPQNVHEYHHFYPRPPRGGRPGQRCSNVSNDNISIHALREEGDKSWQITPVNRCKFLSTPSARRATAADQIAVPPDILFLSTPSARRATAFNAFKQIMSNDFYPRPPRGGRRTCCRCGAASRIYFYPRPPRGGRPSMVWSWRSTARFLSTPSARRATNGTTDYIEQPEEFLSTPSARRATLTSDHARRIQPHYFYPRPPRGGRRHPAQLVWLARSISIHALREEGDPPPTVEAMPPMVISIHALREEGDPAPLYGITPPAYFYPRPPRGGRQ